MNIYANLRYVTFAGIFWHMKEKVNKDGTLPLKVSYPKFKNGEATVRSQKIEQNFGK